MPYENLRVMKAINKIRENEIVESLVTDHIVLFGKNEGQMI